jgi:hypothetical protein
MEKKMKWLWISLGVLGIVGGLVHVLQPLGLNLLDVFGKVSKPVQFIAGASTITYILKKML